MNVLELHQVGVSFGKVRALLDVDLKLNASEAMVLVGPNGAGKSTLIHVLLGLVRPDRGRLVIDGAERRVDNELKQRVGYLPEMVAFAENLSGRQVMRFFASARGVSRSRLEEVLRRVGLARVAQRAVRGYSHGMRQRLGLGIAILSTPELLILDEPTSGLDQEGLALLWSVIAEWRQAGRMVLMATHDLALVERRVDRVCLLRAGTVQIVDTPRRLREIAALPIRVSFSLANAGAPIEPLVQRIREYAGVTDLVREGQTLAVEVRPRELLGLLDLRAEHPEAVHAIRVQELGFDLIYEHLLAGNA